MDVGVITPIYPPPFSGGGLRSVSLLAETLSSNPRIDSVTVYSFDGEEDTEIVKGITVNRLGDIPAQPVERINLYAVRKLAPHIQNHDIFHSYNMALHPTVGFISEKYLIPSVAHLNSYIFVEKDQIELSPDTRRWIYENGILRFSKPILFKYMNKINKYISLSNSIKEIYIKNGLEREKVKTISNMMDPTFEDRLTNKTEIPGEDINILFVGELRKSKGVKYLIQSVERLPHNYQLDIYGSGEELGHLREKCEKLGLQSRVKFHGHVSYDNIVNAYETADIFVHPGVWPEPFNRTLLEAMQAGLPAVVTDIGGPPEVVPDKSLICEPKNPEDLAEKITMASIIDEQSEEINRYANDNFHPNIIIEKIISEYQNQI